MVFWMTGVRSFDFNFFGNDAAGYDAKKSVTTSEMDMREVLSLLNIKSAHEIKRTFMVFAAFLLF
uniref:Uncharacterized protein n=1 Tax=Romanomermis culicivorax TaxID=13658 RepID=A0A915KN58_ROMCU